MAKLFTYPFLVFNSLVLAFSIYLLNRKGLAKKFRRLALVFLLISLSLMVFLLLVSLLFASPGREPLPIVSPI